MVVEDGLEYRTWDHAPRPAAGRHGGAAGTVGFYGVWGGQTSSEHERARRRPHGMDGMGVCGCGPNWADHEGLNGLFVPRSSKP